MCNNGERNVGDTSKSNKQRNVKERSHRINEHEELIPVVPSQWKYVYVGEVWRLLGPPTSMSVLTLFSVCYSREGIALSTMRST